MIGVHLRHHWWWWCLAIIVHLDYSTSSLSSWSCCLPLPVDPPIDPNTASNTNKYREHSKQTEPLHQDIRKYRWKWDGKNSIHFSTPKPFPTCLFSCGRCRLIRVASIKCLCLHIFYQSSSTVSCPGCIDFFLFGSYRLSVCSTFPIRSSWLWNWTNVSALLYCYPPSWRGRIKFLLSVITTRIPWSRSLDCPTRSSSRTVWCFPFEHLCAVHKKVYRSVWYSSGLINAGRGNQNLYRTKPDRLSRIGDPGSRAVTYRRACVSEWSIRSSRRSRSYGMLWE